MKGYSPDEDSSKVLSILNVLFRHKVTAEELMFHKRSIQIKAASFARKSGDNHLLEMIREAKIRHTLYYYAHHNANAK
jgi:hypothetical protein